MLRGGIFMAHIHSAFAFFHNNLPSCDPITQWNLTEPLGICGFSLFLFTLVTLWNPKAQDLSSAAGSENCTRHPQWEDSPSSPPCPPPLSPQDYQLPIPGHLHLLPATQYCARASSCWPNSTIFSSWGPGSGPNPVLTALECWTKVFRPWKKFGPQQHAVMPSGCSDHVWYKHVLFYCGWVCSIFQLY